MTDLRGAYLSHANLQGANLAGMDLSGADLHDARYDKDTKFPEGFDPEAGGMVLAKGPISGG